MKIALMLHNLEMGEYDAMKEVLKMVVLSVQKDSHFFTILITRPI